MRESDRRRWMWVAAFFGLMYFLFGFVFGALAGDAASGQMLVIWRWGAWLTSGLAFVVHIAYEMYKVQSSPKAAAFHASAAASLGAFLLAVSANIHGLTAPDSKQGLLALALVLWPGLTAIPAFLAALAIAALLARMRRRS